jgi:pimeloyl-ACP methyl ester carboxylesterase
LLVPGIASTYRAYALLLNRLAENFQTVVYDYPGEQPDDGAHLARISHDHLVNDVFGLMDHVKFERAFVVALSFGSTVALKALHREPGRFPRTALQGGFAHRRFSLAERLALRVGRLVPGSVSRLPLRRAVLTYNSRLEFPSLFADRWAFYIEQNGLTPIRSLAHRVDLLAGLDLRPILPEISTETLLIQGSDDRIVPRRDFDALKGALPRAESVIMPLVGHQPHLTHAEVMAQLIQQWFIRR